MKLPLNFLKAA